MLEIFSANSYHLNQLILILLPLLSCLFLLSKNNNINNKLKVLSFPYYLVWVFFFFLFFDVCTFRRYLLVPLQLCMTLPSEEREIVKKYVYFKSKPSFSQFTAVSSLHGTIWSLQAV